MSYNLDVIASALDVDGGFFAPTIAAIHRYVAPMLGHDGSLRAVKLTVKEMTGSNEPNSIYSIEVMEIENPPSALSRVNPDATDIHPQAGFSPNIQDLLAAVNGQGVSKVTDPATGEPLVVYHGTTSHFNVFSTKKLGSKTGAKSARKGFFFSDSKRTGNSYTAISDYDLVPARYHLGENAETKFSPKTPQKYQKLYRKFNDSYDMHYSKILGDMRRAIKGVGWTSEIKRDEAAEAVKKYDFEVGAAIEGGMSYHDVVGKFFGKHSL